MTPGARNAPKLWPAEPVSVIWIVPSGRPALPHRRTMRLLRIVPTLRWMFRIGMRQRVGFFVSMQCSTFFRISQSR